MRVATYGFRGPTDQLSRIESGLISYSCEISYENPDLIYSNNPDFSSPLHLAAKFPKAKKIFTVMDCPWHSPGYPFDLIKNQLKQANKICAISQTTKQAIFETYDLDSTVIYNPIKNISRNTEIKKDIFCIFVGRNQDSNKNFQLVVDTLKKLGKEERDLIVAGPEKPFWGTYVGLVDDFELNNLYNRAKYYICCTINGGIELPPVEASFANVIPIGCSYSKTSYEFIPDYIADGNADSLAELINNLEKNRVQIAQEISRKAPIRYRKLNYLEVAKKILSIYESIQT